MAILALLLAVAACASAAALPRPLRVGPSNDNNYYLLQLQTCGGQHTIHGLWPQWAEDCSGDQFDLDALSSIRSDMDQYWPSCEGSDNAPEFWQHEWQKHGTCSLLPELQYFSTVLKLYQDNVSSGDLQICFNTDFEVISCPAAAKNIAVAKNQVPIRLL